MCVIQHTQGVTPGDGRADRSRGSDWDLQEGKWELGKRPEQLSGYWARREPVKWGDGRPPVPGGGGGAGARTCVISLHPPLPPVISSSPQDDEEQLDLTTRSLQRASGFVWTCLAMKHERGRRISRWISCGISCRISCRISWSAGHGWCVWSAGSHFKYRWLVTLELHVYGTAHLFLSMCHLTILLRGPHSLLTNYCLDEFFFYFLCSVSLSRQGGDRPQ